MKTDAHLLIAAWVAAKPRRQREAIITIISTGLEISMWEYVNKHIGYASGVAQITLECLISANQDVLRIKVDELIEMIAAVIRKDEQTSEPGQGRG